MCEVKPDNTNHWVCVQREEFVTCDSILNYKLKLQVKGRIHLHSKQLGSQLAFYKPISVRSVFVS